MVAHACERRVESIESDVPIATKYHLEISRVCLAPPTTHCNAFSAAKRAKPDEWNAACCRLVQQLPHFRPISNLARMIKVACASSLEAAPSSML